MFNQFTTKEWDKVKAFYAAKEGHVLELDKYGIHLTVPYEWGTKGYHVYLDSKTEESIDLVEWLWKVEEVIGGAILSFKEIIKLLSDIQQYTAVMEKYHAR